MPFHSSAIFRKSYNSVPVSTKWFENGVQNVGLISPPPLIINTRVNCTAKRVVGFFHSTNDNSTKILATRPPYTFRFANGGGIPYGPWGGGCGGPCWGSCIHIRTHHSKQCPSYSVYSGLRNSNWFKYEIWWISTLLLWRLCNKDNK